MKTTFSILSAVILLNSCTTTHTIVQVGSVNMISSRNIENVDYVQLKTYTNSTEKEKIESASPTIEESVNKAVKSATGGEFLKNVKIYKIDNEKYSVEGDVWGFKNAIPEYRGFRIGDNVIFEEQTSSNKAILRQGKVDAIKNENYAYFKEYGSNRIFEADFTALTKANWTKEEIEQIISKQKSIIESTLKGTIEIKKNNDTYPTSSNSNKYTKSSYIVKIGDMVTWRSAYKNNFGKVIEINNSRAIIELANGKKDSIKITELMPYN